MRLERRRVLSADFTLGASGLVLDGFDGEFGESLHIAQTEHEYQFILEQGDWNRDAETPGGGAVVDGEVLSVNKQHLDGLPEGIRVEGDVSTPLDVSIGASVDMSLMTGPLSIVDARSLSQADALPGDQTAGGDAAPVVSLVAADPPATPPGLTVTSLNFAGDLELSSLGPIVDEPGTSITVTGDATFTSRLLPAEGDDPAQPGGIFLADSIGDRLSVGGLATFEAQSVDATERFNINVGDAGDAKFGSLSLIGNEVVIEDDSPTVLVAIDAAEVQLDSRGVITDAPGATIEVSGNATLRSSDQIFASDFQADFNGDRQIDSADYGLWKSSFGQAATVDTPVPTGDANLDGIVDTADFTFWRDAFGMTASQPGINISDGETTLSVGGLLNLIATTDGATPGATDADRFSITVADAVEANFGTLAFTGGVVSVFEASDTVLSATDPNAPTIPATSTANALALTSAGTITDDGTAVVEVVGLAAFDSTTTSPITLDDQHQFGRLRVSGGAVTVVETSLSIADPSPGTVLSGASDATTLSLTSDGAITDDGTAVVEVVGLAAFDSTTTSPITLDDQHQFGSLRVSGGAVTVVETSRNIADPNPGTVLSGASDANTLSLVSDGAITDDGFASVEVTGLASFGSTTSSAITLDDQHQFGSLQFVGGAVTVVETSGGGSDPSPGTELSGTSDATTLVLTTDGPLTDDATAFLRVALPGGDASFFADGSITLADAGSANSLIVEGHARFEVTTGNPIDVGVDPATGLPADANAQSGTVQFIAPGGNVRIAYDGPVSGAAAALQLAASSQATTAILDTQGSGDLTDSTNATLDLSGNATRPAFAELRAAGRNVVVGNPAAAADTRSFAIETPTLFDPANYLSVEAANASIRAQSQINLLTGLAQRPFSGSFFLQTEGSLAQVGDVFGEAKFISPLTADRVALASVDGGVFFSQIELSSDVDLETTTPNLSVHAGGGESFAALLSTRAEFPLQEIRGGASGEFLPIGVSLDPATTARIDAGGLNDVPVGEADPVITDPAALGDRHSVVAVVLGDAKVGRVSDATGAQADRVGVLVSDTTGNAFLRTLGAAGNEDGGGDEDAAGDGDGGGDHDLDAGDPLETVELAAALAPLGAEPGDLVFSARDLLGDGVSSGSGAAVQILTGVFTAIAFGALKIDTEDADQASTTLTTTRLTSSNGTVTSVGDFEGDAFARVGDEVIATRTTLVGPRAVLDPPSQDENAATTGLVRPRETDEGALFEQRVTLAVGSRGEDNLVVEFEWADVATRRDDSRADPDPTPFTVLNRDNPLGPEVGGVTATPDVAWAPESLDDAVLDGQVSSDLEPLDLNRVPQEAFRLAVARHDYTNEFIASNPLSRFLPTTVRVYNDPAINLFAEDGAVSLNENVLFVEPEVITFQGGDVEYNLSIERPDRPAPEAPRQVFLRPTVFTRAVASTDLQAVAASDAETVLYGKVDPDNPEEWATDVPGERWPQQWEQVEGDYIDDIKARINASPASEGRYKIVTETPRGQLQLEQWIKSDTVDVEAAGEPSPEQPTVAEPLPRGEEEDEPAIDSLDGEFERVEPGSLLPDPAGEDGGPAATLPPPQEGRPTPPPADESVGNHNRFSESVVNADAALGEHQRSAETTAALLTSSVASVLASRQLSARASHEDSAAPDSSRPLGYSSAERRRRRIASLFDGE